MKIFKKIAYVLVGVFTVANVAYSFTSSTTEDVALENLESMSASAAEASCSGQGSCTITVGNSSISSTGSATVSW